LGSGPAGLTAALYTARAQLKPLVFQVGQPGGQLTTTSEIENYPGFIKGIDGNELITSMTEQAQRFGADFEFGECFGVDFSSRPYKIIVDQKVILTNTLIIATGARPRKLDIPSEMQFWAKGVTSCATCDGFFYKGMDVCVIGGGDSACEEALFLTRMCSKVYMIHRRDKFYRASKIMSDRALANPKIEVLWNSVIEHIDGDTKVTGITIKDEVSGKVKSVPLKGVFLGIGHIPNTEPFKGKLDMDENGYMITKSHSTCTNIPGVFACGDCQDHIYRQAVTAAGTGCMAAIEAERWLEANPQ